MFQTNRSVDNLIFSVGRRIYYITFQTSDDNSKIKYGACIFRANKNHLKKDIIDHQPDQHLLTSEKRFNKFPVIIKTTKKMKHYLNQNITRRSRKIAIESKLFKKQCIKLLVNNSVRSRPSQHKFLQERNIYSKMCSIKRRIKRAENNLAHQLSFSEKMRRKAFSQAIIKGWTEISQEDYSWNNHKHLNQFYFRRGNRIYFVICQYNYQTGHLKYGASIFQSQREMYPWEWYDSEEIKNAHFITAYKRFSNWPVSVVLKNQPFNFVSPYQTRSYYAGKIILSKENMEVLKQVFCCFGVRRRNDANKFLSVDKKIHQCNNNLKIWKSELNCCKQEMIEYKAHKKNKKNKKISKISYSSSIAKIFMIPISLIKNITSNIISNIHESSPSNKKNIVSV